MADALSRILSENSNSVVLEVNYLNILSNNKAHILAAEWRDTQEQGEKIKFNIESLESSEDAYDKIRGMKNL